MAWRVTNLSLSDRRVAILKAALTELDQRLSRGLANSGLSQEAAKLIHGIHESEVGELLAMIEREAP